MQFKSVSRNHLFLYFQIVLCVLLAVAYGFLTPFYLPGTKALPPQLPPVTKKLVMVMVDGMRKDFAFDPRLMPNLARLAQDGAAGTAQTGAFSMTIAALRAIGSGTDYSTNDLLHNFLRNPKVKFAPKDDKGEKQLLDPRIDSIFNQAAERGLRTALSGDELWVTCFGRAITATAENGTEALGKANDKEVLAGAMKFLAANDFDILVVHFIGQDRAGHNYTPLSEQYRKKARELDGYIGEIEAALPPESTFFVFSDHGMSDTGGHGKIDNPPATVTDAPFVFAKHGIARQSGFQLRQTDLTPTLATLLGTAIPVQSEGITAVDVFAASDRDKALMLLGNREARAGYLKHLETQSGFRVGDVPDAAQVKFAQGDFPGAIAAARTELTALNDLAEAKIRYHIPLLTKCFLALAPLLVLLLILSQVKAGESRFLSWFVSVGWLLGGAGLAYLSAPAGDPLATVRIFLSAMLLWLVCLTGTLLLRLVRQRKLFPGEIAIGGAVTAVLGVLVASGTIAAANIMLFLTVCALVLLGCRRQPAFQLLLSSAVLLLVLLEWAMTQNLFADSKLLRIAALAATALVAVMAARLFDRPLRVWLAGCAGMGLVLTSVRFLTKFEAVYWFVVVLCLLVGACLKRRGGLGTHFYYLQAGLGFMVVYLAERLVRPDVLEAWNQTSIALVASGAAALAATIWLHRRLLGNTQPSLSWPERGLVAATSLVLVTGFAARALTEAAFRPQLGQVAFGLMVLTLAATSLTSVQTNVKIYTGHVLLLAFTQVAFEPLHALFLMVLQLVLVICLQPLLFRLRHRRGWFELAFIAVSVTTYFACYQSLSIGSFFDDGRRSIIGAHITDYSNWNLSVIFVLLTAKLMLVELTTLFPLLYHGRTALDLKRMETRIPAIFSAGLLVFLLATWWQYAPVNRQILPIFVSNLLFVGIRVVAYTLSVFVVAALFSLKWNRSGFWARRVVNQPAQPDESPALPG
ncbi:MAG: alkaline phosphatase family protein [Blastocatellia bacterium]|nr:alkaline phosphatase family protein [Blastocatellia bacterium]